MDDAGAEDVVDPRVKGELDSLNQATTDINTLETDLSEERSKFKALLNDASQQLTEASSKYKKSIDRARPYYDALKEARQANAALLRAVHNFQKSNGIYQAAKETISLAEQRLSEFGDQKVDVAWQEMLNLQTVRFNEAEKDRTRSEKLHSQATKRYEFLSKKAEKIRDKHKKSTWRTKPYFELKERLEEKLQKQRQRVDELRSKLEGAKARYKAALNNLEQISLEIHQKRQLDAHLKTLLEPREDTVDGAENTDDVDSMAGDLDLTGPKTYEDISDLEEELDKCNFEECEEEYSTEEDSFSLTEDMLEAESDASANSSMTSSSASSTCRRHSSRKFRRFRSQMSNVSVEEEPPTNAGNRPPRGKLRRALHEEANFSLNETEPVFEPSRSSADTSANQTSEVKSSDLCYLTYDNLHGKHVTSKPAGPDQDQDEDSFDIFDELC